MLSYTKFLKEMLSNKRKFQENAMVSLTEECSAILQNNLPPKLKDPRSFSILCVVGDITISQALCDLEASSMCKRLHVGELKPTIILIQLVDCFVKCHIRVLEDVPLQVGKFFIPYDFIVMEMEEDAQVPIILGRPFLATVGAMIDIKNGRLFLQVGEEKLKFNLSQAIAYLLLDDACYRVDLLEKVVLKEIRMLSPPRPASGVFDRHLLQ